MSATGELHVVFGASGGLGKAVVLELAARQKRVRAINRNGQMDVPDGVETMAGDASNADSARQCCQGAAVVYNCVNPDYTRWPKLFPPIMHALIDAAASARARLVFGDNLYMYGPVSGPMKETSPYNAKGPKGRVRAEMTTLLMKAHKTGKVRATIGRASDFYGPGVLNAAMGERVFKPTLTRGGVTLIGSLDAPHTWSYIKDVARGLITLAEQEEAFGEIWHLPSAEPLTARQFLNIVFKEARARPKVRVAPRWLINLLGVVNPMMRELRETLYQFEQPFVMDHGKFAREFGAQTTPHRQAIRETLDWYRGYITSG